MTNASTRRLAVSNVIVARDGRIVYSAPDPLLRQPLMRLSATERDGELFDHLTGDQLAPAVAAAIRAQL
jgi:hypothetical protein